MRWTPGKATPSQGCIKKHQARRRPSRSYKNSHLHGTPWCTSWRSVRRSLFPGTISPTPLDPPRGRTWSYRPCFLGDVSLPPTAGGPVETIFAPTKQKRACFSTNLSNNPGGTWTRSPRTNPALPGDPQGFAHQFFGGREEGKSKIQ